MGSSAAAAVGQELEASPTVQQSRDTRTVTTFSFLEQRLMGHNLQALKQSDLANFLYTLLCLCKQPRLWRGYQELLHPGASSPGTLRSCAYTLHTQ